MQLSLNLNFANLYRYCAYVDACIAHKKVLSSIDPTLIDHRYFYQINGHGTYACGIAREAVASQLLHYRIINASFIDSLQSLDRFNNNKSVVRFFIEQAVLQTIRSCGLKVHENICNAMDMISFEGFPNFNTKKERVLYVPSEFNFHAIDGLILWLDPSYRKNREKKQAFLFPI